MKTIHKNNLYKFPRTLNKFIVLFVFVGLLFPYPVFSQIMESSSYQMQFDSVNVGGELSTSTSYTLEDTAGEVATGRLNSSSYILRDGYQQYDADVVVTPTTTPETTPATPGGGLIQDIIESLQIVSVEVVPEAGSVSIFWETNHYAISRISWGLTPEYELGTLTESYIAHSDGHESHSVAIGGLSPETIYYFNVEVNDFTTGLQGLRGSFTTIPTEDIVPPASVSNFQAVGVDEKINLSWNNPTDEDFDYVRIVRSEQFFPDNPFEGELVYEGVGTSAQDVNVEIGTTYYYTEFSRDENGNYSSGSIVSGRTVAKGQPPEIVTDPFAEFPESILGGHPLLKDLTLRDFDFIQDGEKIIPTTEDEIFVDGRKNLTISIDYEKLPELLKNIGFTFDDPDEKGKTFSVLLRIDKKKTIYSTTIAPFGRVGTYKLNVHVFDFKNQVIKRLTGSMLVANTIFAINFGFIEILQLVVLTGLFGMIFFLYSRRKEKEVVHKKQHNF